MKSSKKGVYNKQKAFCLVTGPAPTSPYIIAIAVIAAVLLVLVIVVIILCAIKLLHPRHKPALTRIQDFKF